MPKQRKKKYTRSAHPSFVLTHRDLEILWWLYQLKILTTRHIQTIIAGSDQQIARRLRTLYDGNLIAKPDAQRSIQEKNRPTVYALKVGGFRVLQREGRVSKRREWRRRPVKLLTLNHSLAISDFLAGEIANGKKIEPVKEVIAEPGEIGRSGIRPDAAYFESGRKIIYLEFDMGTMSCHQIITSQNSKISRYRTARLNRRYLVVHITKSRRRMHKLVKLFSGTESSHQTNIKFASLE